MSGRPSAGSRVRRAAREGRAGLRLLADLPRLLRRPLTREEAASTIARRLVDRDRNFLTNVRTGVFENPQSPYLALFREAGLAFGDVASLVSTNGLEAALESLRGAGVFLSRDELKGASRVRRGRLEFGIPPGALRHPLGRGGLPSVSSGSRGPRNATPVDLRFLRERSANLRSTLAARGGESWIHAEWHTLGGWGIKHVLELAGAGFTADRWFAQIDERGRGLSAAYRWSVGSVRAVASLCGRPLPKCELALPERPFTVLEWIDRVRSSGQTPHLTTYPSTAVALSAAAARADAALEGLELTLLGEPLSRSRRDVLERAGARVFTRYGSTESGPIGAGCLRPETSDDMHLYRDLLGAITDTSERLYVTTLLSSAPLILINAAIGDRARIEMRRCRCRLELEGWHDHIHSIRSDAIISAEGAKVPVEAVSRALEEDLPGRFGGVAGDFQLIESEDPDGRWRLRLRAHPRLGDVPNERFRNEFLDAIGDASSLPGATLDAWRAAGTVIVERRPPEAGASGKILVYLRDRRELWP